MANVDPPWLATLRGELAAVPGLAEATSRFGSGGRLAWRAGRREVAHLHAPPYVDIRLPRAARGEFAGDARLVAGADRAEWIECRVVTPEDALFAAALIRRAAQR